MISSVQDISEHLYDTLIVVCCHAIYTGGEGGVQNEQSWLIESFQTGETPTFTKHAEEGVRVLSQHYGQAILTFSGGATKANKIRELKEAGKLSVNVSETTTEAESYERVAKEMNFFDRETPQGSIFQERFATDSYQNILLALLQYPIWRQQQQEQQPSHKSQDSSEVKSNQQHEAGSNLKLHLPRKLVIVSHEFKRARFLKLHVPAILSLLEPLTHTTPLDVEYIGINPPFDEVKMKEIEEGDRARGYGVWQGDLHGTGNLLSQKRIARGWKKEEFMGEIGDWYSDVTRLQIAKILDGTIL